MPKKLKKNIKPKLKNLKCKIAGCEEVAAYRKKMVCQKHYFRFMRYGTYELTAKPAKKKIVTPNGYVKVYAPNHPLNRGDNRVFEHRFVYYEKYGEDVSKCVLCGREINWKTCHIDHIDRDKENNNITNLRAICRWCNTSRDMIPQHEHKGCMSISYKNKTQTPEEWSREPGIKVSGSVIRYRIRKGMSVEDAFYAPKITHKNRKC